MSDRAGPAGTRSGRHEIPGARPRGFGRIIAAAVVALLAATGGITWVVTHRGTPTATASVGAGSGPGTATAACPTPVEVRVATVTEYQRFVESIGRSFVAARGVTGGTCAKVLVTASSALAAPAATIAKAPTAYLGAAVDLQEVRTKLAPAALASPTPTVVGRTYTAVATPAADLEQNGWAAKAPSWAELTAAISPPGGGPGAAVIMADPTSSLASQAAMAAVIATAQGRPTGQVDIAGMSAVPAEMAILGVSRAAGTPAASQSDILTRLSALPSGGGSPKGTVAFLDELAVLGYNEAHPDRRLQAFFPGGTASGVDIAAMTVTGQKIPGPEQTMAAAFVEYLASAQGRAALLAAGVRSSGTETAAVSAESGLPTTPPQQDRPLPSQAVRFAFAYAWGMLQNPGRYLLVLDVSGSMKAKVPGTTKTKLQLAQEAAVRGTAMMPPNGEIGFWEFSTKVDGKRDFIELVPMRKVSATVDGTSQLAVLRKAFASVKPVDGTALYDTTLAAYAQMVSTYRAGTQNVIIIVTDGRNDDPGSPSLAATLARLRATSVGERKVPIYTIGYGGDADSAALKAISNATGGQYYQALDPRDISKVFFEALLPRPGS